MASAAARIGASSWSAPPNRNMVGVAIAIEELERVVEREPVRVQRSADRQRMLPAGFRSSARRRAARRTSLRSIPSRSLRRRLRRATIAVPARSPASSEVELIRSARFGAQPSVAVVGTGKRERSPMFCTAAFARCRRTARASRRRRPASTLRWIAGDAEGPTAGGLVPSTRSSANFNPRPRLNRLYVNSAPAMTARLKASRVPSVTSSTGAYG